MKRLDVIPHIRDIVFWFCKVLIRLVLKLSAKQVSILINIGLCSGMQYAISYTLKKSIYNCVLIFIYSTIQNIRSDENSVSLWLREMRCLPQIKRLRCSCYFIIIYSVTTTSHCSWIHSCLYTIGAYHKNIGFWWITKIDCQGARNLLSLHLQNNSPIARVCSHHPSIYWSP